MHTPQWRELKGLILDVKGDLKPADRGGAFEARHLSKYIFPLQYNLSNVFCTPPSKSRDEQFSRTHLMIREEEIEVC